MGRSPVLERSGSGMMRQSWTRREPTIGGDMVVDGEGRLKGAYATDVGGSIRNRGFGGENCTFTLAGNRLLVK